MAARISADRHRVLEIGSGTGQHAVAFGAALRHLVWQPSDLLQCHAGIQAWLDAARLPNVLPPVALDLHDAIWKVGRFDAFFSANVVHIVDWAGVEGLFDGIARHREPDSRVALYGPFNYGGHFTSQSSAAFDAWLRQRDSGSGIRDFEAIDALAEGIGLRLLEDNPMPANNRLLVWGGRVGRRHLPRFAGHRRGVEAVRETVRACAERGVGYLTLFAFSSENWRRPAEEVALLMQLFIGALENEVQKR